MAIQDASVNGTSATGPVYLYFAPLVFLVFFCLPHNTLLDIVTSYTLKNRLHCTANQVATFRVLTAVPLYFSFLFGLARDQWNPLGLKDRGFLIVFAPLTAATFIAMALSELSYAVLFGGMLLAMILFRFVMAACQGLISLVGQERLMSGRLSALWNLAASLPATVGAVAAGYLVIHLPSGTIFLVVAGLTLLVGAMGLWKPAAVFDQAYEQPQARGAGFVSDVKRLLKHRAVYPAVMINFLFQFSPGANTPLQFYLTNVLHASDETYGYFCGTFFASMLPAFLLYGVLCRRFSLRTLLWWGTIISIPQYVPLVFIHSANSAVALAVPMGLMGGIGAVAVWDLAMRSCPPGLQGTLMMLVDGFLQLGYRGGDVLGTAIYGSSPAHGFLYCVLVTTGIYVLGVPLLLLIPKDVGSTADGKRYPVLIETGTVEAGTTSRMSPVGGATPR